MQQSPRSGFNSNTIAHPPLVFATPPAPTHTHTHCTRLQDALSTRRHCHPGPRCRRRQLRQRSLPRVCHRLQGNWMPELQQGDVLSSHLRRKLLCLPRKLFKMLSFAAFIADSNSSSTLLNLPAAPSRTLTASPILTTTVCLLNLFAHRAHKLTDTKAKTRLVTLAMSAEDATASRVATR